MEAAATALDFVLGTETATALAITLLVVETAQALAIVLMEEEAAMLADELQF